MISSVKDFNLVATRMLSGRVYICKFCGSWNKFAGVVYTLVTHYYYCVNESFILTIEMVNTHTLLDAFTPFDIKVYVIVFFNQNRGF